MSGAALVYTHANEAAPTPVPEMKAATISFGEAKDLALAGQKELEAVTFADFDGDGKVDAISGNYGGNLFVRKGQGDGNLSFAAPVKLQRNGADIKLKHW